MKPFLALSLALLMISASSLAYQVLLDIDTDDDPDTINQFTEETSATVRLVLAPEGGAEWIGEIFFGLGGTCWMCSEDGFHMYGTDTDLFDTFWPDPWLDHPLFGDNWCDSALCIDCCGNPGYHYIYYADAAGDGFLLEGNIFLRSFEAWDIDHPLCDEPPPDLMAFACGGDPCNIIMLSGYTSTKTSVWSSIKALF